MTALVRAPFQLLSSLRRHRELVWALARREIAEQYAGRALGTLWAVANPLLLISLYVFLFAYVFPARMPDRGGVTGNYTVYILAGLVPWLAFADSMNRASGSIVQNGNLVKQVVFPVETLPTRSAVASLFTQVVTTVLVLGYMLLFADGIPWTAAFLPALLAIQFAAMVGTAILLATLTVLVRDVREVVAFFTTAGLFLAPILYMPQWVESLAPWARWALELNPFTHLIHCHRDLLFDGRMAHPASWVVLCVLAFAALAAGGATFRRCHHVLGDMV